MLVELRKRKYRGKPIGEATLAKMEWVITNETMPPAKFTAVHWGSRVSSDDRAAILDWVKASRAAHYATDLAAPQRANEPLQPLPDALPVNAAKVALGEKLYNDKRISGDNTVSCATCHDFQKAGTDNQRFAEGIRGQFGDINAPTVFNAAFNVRQFWNGRAADLQEQAGGPPLNPIEMGSKNWDDVCAKFAQDAELTVAFTAVYPDGWSGKNITEQPFRQVAEGRRRGPHGQGGGRLSALQDVPLLKLPRGQVGGWPIL